MKTYLRLLACTLLLPAVMFKSAYADSFDATQALEAYQEKIESISLLTLNYTRVTERPASEGEELDERALQLSQGMLVSPIDWENSEAVEAFERVVQANRESLGETFLAFHEVKLVLSRQIESMKLFSKDGDLEYEVHREGSTIRRVQHLQRERMLNQRQSVESIAREFPLTTDYEGLVRHEWFPFDWQHNIFTRMNAESFQIEAMDVDAYRIALPSDELAGRGELVVQKIEGEWLPVEMTLTRPNGSRNITRYAEHVKKGNVLIPSVVVKESYPSSGRGVIDAIGNYTVSYFLTN